MSMRVEVCVGCGAVLAGADDNGGSNPLSFGARLCPYCDDETIITSVDKIVIWGITEQELALASSQWVIARFNPAVMVRVEICPHDDVLSPRGNVKVIRSPDEDKSIWNEGFVYVSDTGFPLHPTYNSIDDVVDDVMSAAVYHALQSPSSETYKACTIINAGINARRHWICVPMSDLARKAEIAVALAEVKGCNVKTALSIIDKCSKFVINNILRPEILRMALDRKAVEEGRRERRKAYKMFMMKGA